MGGKQCGADADDDESGHRAGTRDGRPCQDDIQAGGRGGDQHETVDVLPFAHDLEDPDACRECCGGGVNEEGALTGDRPQRPRRSGNERGDRHQNPDERLLEAFGAVVARVSWPLIAHAGLYRQG